MPPTVSPTIATLRGREQLSKMRSVVVNQSTTPTVSWTMVDDNGDAIDITAYDSSDYEVVLAARHTMGTQSEDTYYSTGSISSAVAGLVTAQVPADVMLKPGIYVAEIAVRSTDGDETIHLINRFWLVIDRSLFGKTDQTGPPTIAEIRLHLRDFPEGNFLLDEYEFDPAEIAASISRCVMYFNEAAPPIQKKFNTTNFPFRYHWMEGIVAELFLTAAHQYRRNSIKTSAAGLATADLDKEKEYLQAHLMHKQAWLDFVKTKKCNLNMQEGFGSLGSPYSMWHW